MEHINRVTIISQSLSKREVRQRLTVSQKGYASFISYGYEKQKVREMKIKLDEDICCSILNTIENYWIGYHLDFDLGLSGGWKMTLYTDEGNTYHLQGTRNSNTANKTLSLFLRKNISIEDMFLLGD